MNFQDKVVCKIFNVKDVYSITRPALINSLANLAIECEKLNNDLFVAAPNHERFKSLPKDQRMQMKIMSAKKRETMETENKS